MGEPVHGHGLGDGVPAAAPVPDADARRRCDVARRHRGCRRGRQQRAEGRLGLARGSHTAAEAARAGGLHAVVLRAAPHGGCGHVDAGPCHPTRRPPREGHSRRAARRDARRVLARGRPRPGLRLPPGDGSRGRRRRSAPRLGVSLLLSRRLPDAVLVDARPRRGRDPDPAARAEPSAPDNVRPHAPDSVRPHAPVSVRPHALVNVRPHALVSIRPHALVSVRSYALVSVRPPRTRRRQFPAPVGVSPTHPRSPASARTRSDHRAPFAAR
jgi:hypothetical protein